MQKLNDLFITKKQYARHEANAPDGHHYYPTELAFQSFATVDDAKPLAEWTGAVIPKPLFIVISFQIRKFFRDNNFSVTTR